MTSQCLVVWLLNTSHSPLLYSIFMRFNLSNTGSVFVELFGLHGVKLQVKRMSRCLMFPFFTVGKPHLLPWPVSDSLPVRLRRSQASLWSTCAEDLSEFVAGMMVAIS